MSEEEIQKAFIKYELNKYNNMGFNTPKSTLLTYFIIAQFEGKRLKIVKINRKKCETKIITHKGLETSFANVSTEYNKDLEHKKRNIKIIDFEII